MPGVPREPDPPWIIDQRRHIGVRVRQAREHADLTQERLADLSGVKRLTLQNIESGATDARIGWLLRIARTLNVHVTAFLG